MNDQWKKLGDELHEARVNRTTVAPLRERVPGMTIDDAYAVQSQMVARRLADGEQIVGKKIGVTSKAIQERVGFDQPDFGQLTSGMCVPSGEAVALDHLIQPRAEAELAFVLKADLKGPGITAMDVVRATDYVVPCFEIVDSRIRDWDIGILDTIADNASCGVYILGEDRADPRAFDLALAGMVVDKNGELAATGVGAAVQGSPVNAVVWLANTLGRLGQPFSAGEVILSGSQSPLIDIEDGDELVCSVGGLGVCKARFTGRSVI